MPCMIMLCMIIGAATNLLPSEAPVSNEDRDSGGVWLTSTLTDNPASVVLSLPMQAPPE